MADNSKQPHARPPLAHTGGGHPLARREPGESAPAPGGLPRPAGLHTRPDMFGASGVMPRQSEPSREASASSDRGKGMQFGNPTSREQEAGSAEENPDPPLIADTKAESDEDTEPADVNLDTLLDLTRKAEAAFEQPHADETSETRETEAKPAAPEASPLEHPVRLSDLVAFDDWPDGADRHEPVPDIPDGEMEAGARSPEGVTSPAGPPEQPAGPPPLPEWRGDETAAMAAAAEAKPSEEKEQQGILSAGLQALQSFAQRRENRRPLALAAVSSAALLLAVLVASAISWTGGDEVDTQVAAGPEQALPEGIKSATSGTSIAVDTDGRGVSGEQGVPLAPAAGAAGEPGPGDLGEQSVASRGAGVPDSSQLAALPDPGAPGNAVPDGEPIVDFMRIDPDGRAVVAGRAIPGTELIILDNGEPLGDITADIYGLWTFVSPDPLPGGRHEIGLRVRRQGSELSDPALVTENGAASSSFAGIDDAASKRAPLGGGETSQPDATIEGELAALGAPVQSDAPATADMAETAAAPAETLSDTPAAPPASETQSTPQEDAIAASESPTPTDPAGEPAAAFMSETQPSGSSEPEAAETAENAASENEAAVAPDTPAAAPAPEPKPEPPASTQVAATTAASETSTSGAAAGKFVIQFASFKSIEGAEREQAIVEKRFSDLLIGRKVFVEQADLADQGIYYRLRSGPFATLADARSACARFQERDRDCLAMAR